MYETMRRLTSVFAGLYGNESAARIMSAAFDALPVNEQAAVGLVLQLEEDVAIEHASRVLRHELLKRLPQQIQRMTKKLKVEMEKLEKSACIDQPTLRRGK